MSEQSGLSGRSDGTACGWSVFKRVVLLGALFAGLIVALFHEGWLGGQVIQGIDGNYSQMRLDHMNLVDGRAGSWDPVHWLGSGRVHDVNLYNVFARFFPDRLIAVGGYSVTLFATLVFMWLWLRRLKVTRSAALFGSLAFGFSPHFVTLIYPGHVFAVYDPAFAAILFYFLTAALDGQSTGWRAWLCVPAAGFGWGMLMNSDVQRGLYFSVAAAAYGLFLIFRTLPVRNFALKNLVAPARLACAARLTLAGLFTLLLFAHNAKIQFGSELVRGQISGIEESSPQAEAERWAFATSWSLHPKELLDSLAPGYHGMISGDPERPYWGERPVAHSNDGMGFFVVFFGLAGAVAAFRSSGTARFFVVAAVLATLLAFGQYWPGRPFFALWYHLPMMDKMRAPAKFMSVTALALSVLSAYGFQNLLDALRNSCRKTLKRWTVSGAVLLGLGLLGLISATDSAAFASPQIQSGALRALLWMSLFALLTVALIAPALLKKPVRFQRQLLSGGFLLLLIISLFQINRFYIQRSWVNPEEFYQSDEVLQFLKSRQTDHSRVACSLKMTYQGRMVPLSLMAARDFYVTHFFQYSGVESMENTPQSRIAGDYDAFFKAFLPPVPQAGSAEQFAGTLLEGQLRFWRLSSVKYIITDGYLYGISQQPLAVFEILKKNPNLSLCFTGTGFGGRRLAVFELKDSVPQFSLVSAIELVASREEALARMRSADFNLQATVVIATNDLPVVPATGSLAGMVHIESYRPGDIRLRCETAEPAVLRWVSRFDKGWQARVDGVPVELVPVNFMMSGLPVPAGTHEVVLRYNPQSQIEWLSAGMAVLGLLLVPVAAFAVRRQSSAAEA